MAFCCRCNLLILRQLLTIHLYNPLLILWLFVTHISQVVIPSSPSSEHLLTIEQHGYPVIKLRSYQQLNHNSGMETISDGQSLQTSTGRRTTCSAFPVQQSTPKRLQSLKQASHPLIQSSLSPQGMPNSHWISSLRSHQKIMSGNHFHSHISPSLQQRPTDDHPTLIYTLISTSPGLETKPTLARIQFRTAPICMSSVPMELRILSRERSLLSGAKWCLQLINLKFTHFRRCLDRQKLRERSFKPQEI